MSLEKKRKKLITKTVCLILLCATGGRRYISLEFCCNPAAGRLFGLFGCTSLCHNVRVHHLGVEAQEVSLLRSGVQMKDEKLFEGEVKTHIVCLDFRTKSTHTHTHQYVIVQHVILSTC